MSAPLVQEWIAKAEQDWQAALQLLAGRPEAVPDVIAFHAQQTAEKYLKALLHHSGEDPPPIHSLGALLSPFAVRFRYPGYSLTVDKARESIERTRRIRATLRSQLGLST